jgi:hypothetical protein
MAAPASGVRYILLFINIRPPICLCPYLITVLINKGCKIKEEAGNLMPASVTE